MLKTDLLYSLLRRNMKFKVFRVASIFIIGIALGAYLINQGGVLMGLGFLVSFATGILAQMETTK